MALTTIEPFGINSSNSFTFGNVTATGNVTGTYFVGNGSQLTGITAGTSYTNANVEAYLPTYTGNLTSLTGNVTTTANISASYVLGNGSQLTGIQADLSAVAANILPATDVTYDLGSATHRWRDIYLSGNTINLGGATIKTDAASGAIALIPEPTVANPNPSGMVVSPSGGITVVSTVGGEVSGNAIANAAASPTAAPVPIDITTTPPVNGQALIWDSVNSEFVPGNVAGGGGTPGGTNTQIQFNNSGEFGGSANLTWSGTTLNVIGAANISANITVGNILTDGYFYANGEPFAGGVVSPVTITNSPKFVGALYSLTSAATVNDTRPVINTFNTVVYDTSPGAAFTSTLSRFTIPSGVTKVKLGTSTADPTSVTGQLIAQIIKNGDTTYSTNFDIESTGGDFAAAFTAPIPVVAGDYFQVAVFSTSSRTIDPDPFSWFSIEVVEGSVLDTTQNVTAPIAVTGNIVPIDITTTPPTNGQALIWNAANSEFVPGNVSAGGSTATVYGNIASLPLANVATGTMAFVSSNNRLYLWNGTGWFNIALINTNPTITGGADPTYLFATDGTPIVLTLTASDPEGIPLTWSYQVTSGALGNTATVSQADNVFTITPSTSSVDGGVFELTFSASDGVNVGTTSSTFTLRFSAADPYYQQSVLLSTTATNNGTNNTFVDSSTNNATVTRHANTTQGAFGAFSPAGWSGYFDGTGDYLSTTVNTSLNVPANTDFTVEGWCYLNARTATRPAIFSNYNSFTTGGLSFWAGHGSSTTTQFQVGLNGTFPALNAGTIPYNSWFHWAIVRNGTGSNNITVYINGTSIGTISSNVAITTTGNNLWLGASGDSVANAGINGYMSNFRWVTGTAVYTANFTPPAQLLTAVSGTGLLTLQSNRFVDNSSNAFAITRIGNTRIEPFSPFSPTSPYVTSSNGGSGYFDGTGDYLSVPYSTSAFDWWTTNYTIEAWVYPTSFTGWSYSDGGNIKPTLIGNKAFNTTEHYWGFGLNTSGNVYFAYFNGTSQGAGSSGTATLNAWNHIAVVVNGGTITVYLNGVGTVLGTVSGTPQASASVPLTIGAGNNSYINGYVSGLRVVKGTAVYTSNFTPPTAPPTAITNTSLLMNFANANIFDQTGKVVLETVGDAKTSTAVVKYGSTSMAFDGSGDYLLSPSDPVFDFPGNFTIEMWVNFVNVNSTWQSIISRAYGVAGGWRLYKNDGNNQLRWYSNLTSVVLTTGSTLANNTWHHIAVVRNSGTVTIFIDGINRGSAANATSYTPGNYALEIGQGVVTSTFPMNGYISDLRITNGVARYTANFTPPTAQLGYNNPE